MSTSQEMTRGTMCFEESDRLFEAAKKVIPGGVNSPVRAFKSVGRNPVFIERAEGAYLYDVDGNKYLDMICSWGPMILGHGHPVLTAGIEDVFKMGTSYGMPSRIEVEMAEKLCSLYPSMDMVRMVNSGTEATMSAIRVARGYTNRNKMIKFEGCYHGHSDALLVKSGSGTLTYGVPTSPGVPADVVKDTLVGKYNDLAGLRALFEANPDSIACVIVEAVAGNMGVVAATKEFLEGMRELCTEHGAVLIFDEVITGFRIALGGAAQVYGVEPDLACFGKIIGGGLPVGAYGGKREIMSVVSPVGPVYQAGTLSGNPLAMCFGLRTLTYLEEHPEVYTELENKAAWLVEKVQGIIDRGSYPMSMIRYKSMPCLFFAKGEMLSYDDVKACDTQAYGDFFRRMLERGYLLPPAQFEGWFLSTAHTSELLQGLVKDLEEVLKEMYPA